MQARLHDRKERLLGDVELGDVLDSPFVIMIGERIFLWHHDEDLHDDKPDMPMYYEEVSQHIMRLPADTKFT